MAGVLQFILGMQSGQYNAALKQSTGETKKFTEAAAAAAKATTSIQSSWSKAQQAAAQRPPGSGEDPMEKHAVSARHLSHELRLVGEATALAGGEMGALGSLAGLIFNPWLLAIGALVVAADLLKARWAARMDQMQTVLTNMVRLANVRLEAMVTATNAAADSNAEFALSLAHSADGIDRESQAMERRIALFDATVAAQRDVFSAQEQTTDAVIAADEALHRITPMEAQRRRNAAETAARTGGNAAELASMQNEIDQKEQRLNDADTRLRDAQTEHRAAVEAATPGRASVEGAQGFLDTARQNRDAAVAKAAESKAKMETIGSLTGNRGILFNRAKAMADIDKQQALDAQQYVLDAEKKLSLLQRQQTFFEAAVEKAKKHADIEQSVVNSYGQQVQQAKDLLAIKKHEQEQLMDLLKQRQAQELRHAKALVMGQVVQSFGATNMEKMGFHFGAGGPTLLIDHARTTAAATRETAANTRVIARHLSLQGTFAGLGSMLAYDLANRMP